MRYEDDGEREYKLNAERQNGRAAMMGITGCLWHEVRALPATTPVTTPCNHFL